MIDLLVFLFLTGFLKILPKKLREFHYDILIFSAPPSVAVLDNLVKRL